jgi:hypothetical protein
LEQIPQMENLSVLNCASCNLLRQIPYIANLQILNCAMCPRLTRIPMINSLYTLICSDCDNLIRIPSIKTLRTLYCNNCPRLAEFPLAMNLLYCGPRNRRMPRHVQRLSILQRRFRTRRQNRAMFQYWWIYKTTNFPPEIIRMILDSPR